MLTKYDLKVKEYVEELFENAPKIKNLWNLKKNYLLIY